MVNVVLLMVCFGLGIVFRRLEKFPHGSHAALNAFVIYVSLPATVLYYIHGLALTPEFIFLAAMPWIIFFLAFPFIIFADRVMHLGKSTAGALLLTAGFGNTSFVGLPMIEAFFGKEFLGYGIVADQPGSFLALSIPGILTAVHFSSGNISAVQMAKRVIVFPPFIAIILAVILFPFEYPEWLNGVLLRLSDTLAPVALLSVGLQIRFRAITGRMPELMLGLGYKMILAPLFIFLLYGIFSVDKNIWRISVFEAAMAPMITAGIVAQDHGLDPELVSLMLGVGIPLSFLSLFLWHRVLVL